MLTGAHLLHDMSLGFLGMLLPLLRTEIGFSLTQAGLLQPAQQIGSFFQPMLGSWADRVGAKRFVVTFLITTSIFMSLTGTAPAFWVLLLLVFLGGISSAAYHPAGSAFVSSFSGERLGTGLAVYHFGGNVGLAIGPLAVGAIATGLTRQATPLLAVPALVWAALVLLTTKENRGSAIETDRRTDGLRWMWSHREVFAPLVMVMLGRAIGSGGFSLFLPTLLAERGYDLGMVATITSGYFLVGGIGGLTTGWLSDKVGRHRVLRTLLIVAPLSVGGFLLLGGGVGLFLLLLAAAALLGEQPVLMALVQEWAPKRRGTVVGLVLGGQFVLAGLGSLLIGWVGDMAGLEGAFRIVAVAPLMGLPFIGRLRVGPIE